ncbi:unnamed protein product [Dimorphilus gyrociliatus]|uniref:Uncharacterized protein n=1 Tax=Dimorphilus gyrociliatus TaxID=2664684 RepID=A0A7I8WE59_9ANNE|nr:unnamed protein product [Dimorphilus gyrociliatus]
MELAKNKQKNLTHLYMYECNLPLNYLVILSLLITKIKTLHEFNSPISIIRKTTIEKDNLENELNSKSFNLSTAKQIAEDFDNILNDRFFDSCFNGNLPLGVIIEILISANYRLRHISIVNILLENDKKYIEKLLTEKTVIKTLNVREQKFEDDEKFLENILNFIDKNSSYLEYIEFGMCTLSKGIDCNSMSLIGMQNKLSLLHFFDINLNDTIASKICENLSKYCSKITKLTFSRCGLTSNIGTILGEAIGKQTKLVVLNLQNNQLGNKVGKCIFDNIKENCRNLTVMGFGNCSFTHEIGDCIAKCLENLENLQDIQFWDNNLQTSIGRDIFQAILNGNCRNITKIGFSNCGFTEEIGNVVGQVIGRQKNLSFLNFHKNPIGNEIGENIFENIYENCKYIEEMYFGTCNFTSDIGDCLSKAIGRQRLLKSMNFQNNPLGNDIGKNIFDCLNRNCHRLTVLGFGNCNFSNGIGNVLGDAVGKQNNLTEIQFWDNNLGDETGRNLFENIKLNCRNIKVMGFDSCGFTSAIGDCLCDAIGMQKSLIEIHLSNNSLGNKVGDNIFRNIINNKCTRLQIVNLINCGFDDKINGNMLGRAIGKQRNLCELGLCFNPLGSTIGKSLFKSISENCHNLTFIGLNGCNFNEEIGSLLPCAIGKQKQLKTISLSLNDFKDEIGRKIFENIERNCRNLTTVAFAKCGFTSQIGSIVGKAIGRQKYLENLLLRSDEIGDDVAREIFVNIRDNCTNITTLIMKDIGVTNRIETAIGEAISKQTNLLNIDLSSNPLTSTVGRNIFESIYKNCHLIYRMHFDDCCFNHEIGDIVGKMIGKLENLSTLWLEHNSLGGDVGRVMFENMKLSCKKLVEIYLSDCHLTSKVGNLLGESFGRQKYLSIILIKGNCLGNEVGRVLFQNLRDNCCHIKKMGLGKCNFTDEIGQVLPQAIGKQKYLQVLSLEHNQLGDEMGKSILKEIEENCENITEIYFSHCNFTSEIGFIIGKIIEKCKHLSVLSFRGNQLRNEIGRDIFQNIYKHCRYLKLINFEYCGFTVEIGDIINKAVMVQPNLKILKLHDPFYGESHEEFIKNVLKPISI